MTPRRPADDDLPDDVVLALSALVGSADVSDPAAVRAVAAPLRPRRESPATHRVRVDLEGTGPPVWRRLDLASDLSLDVVHQVLQSALGWTDSHLHRFSVGGGAFDRDALAFATVLDVEEDDDEGMLAERDVRLDEVLAEPGDVLQYTYDFGDGWEHTIRLEEVRPRAADDARPAVVVTGRRACAPEDVGGSWGYAELLATREAAARGEELDDDDAARLAWAGELDPEAFDVAVAQRSVDIALGVLEAGAADTQVPDAVQELLDRATGPGRATVAALVVDAGLVDLDLSTSLAGLDDVDVDSAVLPWRTLLSLVGPEGTPLTAAGWLKPDVVVALLEVIDPAHAWIGKGDREDLTVPVADFRAAAQELRLVRRLKGRLVLTPAGRRVAGDPRALLEHLLRHLPAGRAGGERNAGLLALLALAGGRSPVDGAALALEGGMDALGWSVDGRPVHGHELRWAARTTLDVLRHLGALVEQRRVDGFGHEDVVGPHGQLLARLALRSSP